MALHDSDTSDPLLGKKVGNTMVLQKVGDGAVATVYQAMELDAEKRLVALKVIHRTEQRLLRADGETKNPFAREHRVSKAAQHPGIIRIFDIGNTPDGRHYASMEYVEGNTLADEIKHRGHLGWREALELLTETAAAVGALHEADIVHRDIKPANIMAYQGKDRRLHVKLIDLGLCRIGHERDGAPAGVEPGAIGTPAYMAPEIAVGAGTSKLTDVYALGATFYELLTGKQVIALKRPDAEQILSYLRSKQDLPAIPVERMVADLPLPIQALVRQLCSRDPRARPRDAVAVLAAIERLTKDLPEGPRESRMGALGRALGSLFRREGAPKGRFSKR